MAMSPLVEHVVARLAEHRVVKPDPAVCGCGKAAHHVGRCQGGTDIRECASCGAAFRCRPSDTRRRCRACKPRRLSPSVLHQATRQADGREPHVELCGGEP